MDLFRHFLMLNVAELCETWNKAAIIQQCRRKWFGYSDTELAQKLGLVNRDTQVGKEKGSGQTFERISLSPSLYLKLEWPPLSKCSLNHTSTQETRATAPKDRLRRSN